MANIPELAAVPDVSLMDGMTLEAYRDGLIREVEEENAAITGRLTRLPRADKHRMALNAVALYLYNAEMRLERRFLAQLLKTAYGDDLDQLAATISHGHLKRYGERYATVTVRFRLSAIRAGATPIPIGTRVRGEEEIFFFVKEYAEVPPGELYVDAKCEAITAGRGGNGFLPGDINVLVDPLPFVESVENVNISAGGADVESCEDFTRRIYYSGERFSTAGALDAYRYWAMEWSPDVETVWPFSPAPCHVTVLVLMTGGVTPDEEIIKGLYEHLSAKDKRPLSDKLVVGAPIEVDYEINLTYFIRQDFAASEVHIRQAAERAVDEYVRWQRHIRRDITPGKLFHFLHAVPGIKRVAITSPGADVVIDDRSVARLALRNVVYGGLEVE